MPTFDQILSWAKENELLLGLAVSAAIGTMPEKLPHVKYLHQWLWTWFHDAARAFLNFRRGLSSTLSDPIAIDADKKRKKEQPVVPKAKTPGRQQFNG